MARERELVDLLEKDVIGSGRVLERALMQIGDAGGAHHGNNAADPAAAAAAGNMELMSSFYAKLDEVKAYHSLKEAVNALDCGNERGDCRQDDDDDDDNGDYDDTGVDIGVGPDGSGNDGDCASSLRPRGGGLRGRAASRAARARTTPQRERTAGNDDGRTRRW